MLDLYPSRAANRPQFTKRHEPVAYCEWSAKAPLSLDQVGEFIRNGFLVLEDVFDEKEVALLQRETGGLLADPSSLEPETVVFEPGSKEVRSIFAIHRQSKLMGRLAEDERLAGLASFLLDDPVYLHQTRLNYKPGFEGKEFYWHSDFETWHAEDGMPCMRALSMSVLLAENTPNNGPLMLIPGSHQTFVACVGRTPTDNYKSSLRKQEIGVPDEDSLAELADRHGIVAPTGKAGTVILFDCNMLHGSNGNITPFPRANAFLVYNAISNRLIAPFDGASPRPEFIATREPSAIKPKAGSLAKAIL